MNWYVQWVAGHHPRARVLLPISLRDKPSLPPAILSGGCLWYEPDGTIVDPARHPLGDVWVLNGASMPLLDWERARLCVADEPAEVVVFGPPGSVTTTQYPESLVVDESGRVLKVERHYFDSPLATEVRFGPATFLAARASGAEQAVGHVVAHGWSLDSIQLLGSKATVAWASSPGVLSSFGDLMLGVGLTTGEATADQETLAGWLRLGPPAASGQAGGRPDELATMSDSVPAGGVRQNDAAKRFMDVVLAVLSVVVLSPLLITAALLVKLTSRGPVFYADLRQGKHGREFRCLKFRTMVPNAADLQASLRTRNEVDGPQFKMRNDPRLTKVGGFLRRYNVDELPQLFNVIAGQMSLVGPRPSPDRENQLCPGWRRTRLSLRPGITGLWQVLRLRDDSPSDFQEWIYYDVEYARHRSLWLDVELLLYTPLTMFAPNLVNRLARKLAARGICVNSMRIDQLNCSDAREEPRGSRLERIRKQVEPGA